MNYITKLFLAVLTITLSSCQVQKHPEKPNILFLFTDDQRYNTIRALGNDQLITPNLDQLARRGYYFNNAYIMGSMSGAVCAPSRAMLMTGRNLYHVDPMGYTIDTSHVTLPQWLSENGYITFHTGKWHNGKKTFARSFGSGQHIFFGGMSDHYKVPLHAFDSSGSYPDADVYYLEGEHSAEIYADAAIDFLNKYNTEKPFFMFVSFQTPHDPRNMPEEYKNMYGSKNMELPPNFMNVHPFNNGELDIRDELLAGFPRTEKEVQANIAAYYAMITHTDAQIGRILQKLNEKELADKTVIVFAGDNGLAVGQHGLMGKQNLYEHSIKVPLLFAGPGIPEGMNTDAFGYLFDIYPTLCSFAGISVPKSVMGKSLHPVMNGEKKKVRDEMIFAYKTFQRGYRNEQWKLIKYNVNDTLRTQLFNLEEDPWETNNLASGEVYADTLQALLESMQKSFSDNGDTINFTKSDWNLPVTSFSWKQKMRKENPVGYERLMRMVNEERKLRGF